jgi:hypothetical protein
MKYADFYKEKDILFEIKQELTIEQLYVENLLKEGAFGDYIGKAIELIKKSGVDKATAWFEKWYSKEKTDMGWINKLPDCPCKLEISNGEPKSPDKNFTGPDPILKQFLHPGAKWELRSKEGQQCCYDSKGNLLTRGYGAGTADKESPASKANAPFHFKSDVLPFFIAYYLDGNKHGNHVDQYIDVRPPNVGRDCPANAS